MLIAMMQTILVDLDHKGFKKSDSLAGAADPVACTRLYGSEPGDFLGG